MIEKQVTMTVRVTVVFPDGAPDTSDGIAKEMAMSAVDQKHEVDCGAEHKVLWAKVFTDVTEDDCSMGQSGGDGGGDIKRGCLTCAHAQIELTPTGKPKRNRPVACRAQVPTTESILAALKPVVPASMMSDFCKRPMASAMWPDDGDDGSDCGAWTAKAKEGTT